MGALEFTTAIHGNSWIVELSGGKKVRTTIRATMSDDHSTIHEEVVNSYDGSPPEVATVSTYKRIGERNKKRTSHCERMAPQPGLELQPQLTASWELANLQASTNQCID